MAVVMVVDDDMDVREWIAHCVEQDGHTMLSAVNAPAALDLWAGCARSPRRSPRSS